MSQNQVFRTDVVGSFLRPAPLRQAFKQRSAGEIDDEALRRAQDEAIRGIVRVQEEAGLPVATDGEFRRGWWWGRFVERVDGLTIKPAVVKFRDDKGHEVQGIGPYATAKLRRTRPIAVDEFIFLRDATKLTAKITIPAPSTIHFHRHNSFADPSVYPNLKGFMADLIALYREEIADLAKEGCRYLQLDDVSIALLCDPEFRAGIDAAGGNAQELADIYIDAINQVIANRPAGMTVGVHVCRGNFSGHYVGISSYDWIAERFFQKTAVDRFLLEYDSPRAGDFSPLRFVPKDKVVVLGLVTTKSPAMETIDALKRRVDEATRYVPLERLAFSPQCGFASTARGNPVTEDDQRAKLRLVVDAAKAIWG